MPIIIHHLPPIDVSAGTDQGFRFAPLTLVGPFIHAASLPTLRYTLSNGVQSRDLRGVPPFPEGYV